MASPAPACRQAINDANRRWPRRRKASDGIMGDARHQKSKSDHNLGNAFDLTHDPDSGCDGNVIAAAAIKDPRVKYVIWNRRIYNRQRGDKAFRRYTGKNPHTHHCHVSVLSTSRTDTRPWAWAPGGADLPAAVIPVTGGGGRAAEAAAGAGGRQRHGSDGSAGVSGDRAQAREPGRARDSGAAAAQAARLGHRRRRGVRGRHVPGGARVPAAARAGGGRRGRPPHVDCPLQLRRG